ncbi:MAG TPA: nuclear transport factor 2 family protein [Ktedonobacteraceae bacterium]|nr:nuclear transport factor 2 family protein [Ktedonobacteraceae bacterium]
MSANVDTVKTFITALQSGDMTLAAQTCAPELVVSGLMTRPLGKNEFFAVQSELLAAMPDFSYNLSAVHQDHADIHALIHISGTHTQSLSLPSLGLRPIPPTGLAIDLPQVETLFQVENEQVLAMEMDQEAGGGLVGLLQQVGAELPLEPRRRVMPDPAYPEQEPGPMDIDL